MTIAEKIKIDDDYTVEIHYDDAGTNPLKDFDGNPTLALHERAEGHFGWTTDMAWADRLQAALNEIAERGHTTRLYGEGGALAVIQRWLRAFHGVRVVLPVSAMEHSGTTAYLGDSAHWCDPGGWDSGWIGWLFATPEQITEWGFDDRSDEDLEKSLMASFVEFSAYVEGSVYGYIVTREDGEDVPDDSCWGFYGPESYDEGGHMREAFMEVIDYDRRKRAEAAAELAAQRAADEVEIDEMRLAEVGALA